MRHLITSHIQSTIQRGNEIEQFLGGFNHNEEPAIRYLTIRKEGDEFWLHCHERFDEGDQEYADLYEFTYLDLPDNRWEPYPIIYTTLEEALAGAVTEHGADPNRWVNQGIVQDEYLDYVATRVKNEE